MLKGFFRSNPHHQQSLRVFGTEKSRIDALIFPLNSPVREVMKMATTRMFENSAVDYLLQKWEGKNIPQVRGTSMCELSTSNLIFHNLGMCTAHFRCPEDSVKRGSPHSCLSRFDFCLWHCPHHTVGRILVLGVDQAMRIYWDI